MRSSVRYLVAFLTLALLFANGANACSCVSSGPPCQAYGTVSAVFSGRVAEITSFTRTDERLKFPYQQRLVRFAVMQSFRGIAGDSVEVITGIGGGDCGYAFATGESYLVYAYRNVSDNKLYAGICSRTRRLSEAGEDLEYIQSLANAASGGTIYGAVKRFRRVNVNVPYEPLAAMASIRVTVAGNGTSVETTTDGQGAFRVTNLAPGDYTVRLLPPDGFWTQARDRKVVIADKGCADVVFSIEPNTSLSGRLLDERGAPAANIPVDLVPSDEVSQRHQPHHLIASTNDEGRFDFRSIPPGEYLLGVRLNRITQPKFPYPRTFYPGTQDPALARRITIKEGDTLDGYEIQLPQKLIPRKIEGVVVWPDGKPVANAMICVEEVEYAEGSMCFSDTSSAADGRFSLTVMEGLRYLMRVSVNLGSVSNQRHAEPIELPANGNVSDVKLVITESGGTCAKCRIWTRPGNAGEVRPQNAPPK